MRHFGVLIPSTNTTVEIEYCRLLPADLQVHVARLGKGGDMPFLPSLDADVAYQSQLLGAAKVEVVALAQTSASLFADNYDAVTIRRMREGAGVPAVTSAMAMGQAMRALGARRIAVVSPYSEDVAGRAKRYYETKHGLEVVALEGFGGATNAYAVGQIGPGDARDAFAWIDRPEIEVFAVPGGNFPTMAHVAEWEQEFGKPVITSNQAALWAMLLVMRIGDPVPGLGRLLERMPAAPG